MSAIDAKRTILYNLFNNDEIKDYYLISDATCYYWNVFNESYVLYSECEEEIVKQQDTDYFINSFLGTNSYLQHYRQIFRGKDLTIIFISNIGKLFMFDNEREIKQCHTN
jgi:hypothetical protein